MKFKYILGTLAFLILMVGFAMAWTLRPSQWKDLCVMAFRRGAVKAEIHVHHGQRLTSVAQEMEERGLIADVGNFLFWLRYKNADRSIKAGVYKLSSGPSWDVAQQLKEAVPYYFRATLLPGNWPERPLGDWIPSEEQLELLADDGNFPEAMVEILPQSPLSRAAFLLPDTYLIAEDSPIEVIQAAAAAWWERFGQRVPDGEAAMKGAVVASLIQREGLFDSEYPIIAGVVENRLKAKMPLQIDATVIYAWHLEGTDLTRVYYRHLEIPSPYNTYHRRGLPPGPICVPSAKAWEAALAPQNHNYFYYVARGDGTHQFSRTYQEHQEAVELFRR